MEEGMITLTGQNNAGDNVTDVRPGPAGCKEAVKIQELKQIFPGNRTGAEDFSPLVLAWIGDAVYGMIIRTLLISDGNMPVDRLNKKASRLVCAKAQADVIHVLMDDVLNEEEKVIFRRGRNAKSFSVAKNASVTDYRHATGMEALCGYLYLKDDINRLLYLLKEGLERSGLWDIMKH